MMFGLMYGQWHGLRQWTNAWAEQGLRVVLCVGLGYNSEVWTEALHSSIMLRHGLRLRSEAWTEAEV